MLQPLYDRVLRWAAHRDAPWYLAAVSFVESWVFPIPTAFMLLPMVYATPQKGIQLATIATVSSVLGGVFGYLLGYCVIEVLLPWIIEFGYQSSYELAQQWFQQWGGWALFLAGFSPIPYKIFTITAGSLSMSLLPFVLASLVGRGSQFFLIAGLVMWLGPKFAQSIRRYLDWIGWGSVLLAVVLYLILKN